MMKKLLLLTLLNFALFSCEEKIEKQEKYNITEDQELDSLQNEIDSILAVQQTWSYKTQVSEMDDSENTYSYIISLNYVDLNFPYENSRGSIMVFNTSNMKNVVFSLTEGQLDADEIRVRFDDEEPQYFKVEELNPVEPTIAIIEPEKFIHKLSSTDTLRIQLDIYQQGSEIFRFHSSNLDLSRLE